MADVSSGDGKGVIFSVLIALSCGVNNVQEELFILMSFTLWGNFNQKSKSPPGATSILPILVGTVSKCVLYCSRYRHIKFRTCMKYRTIFAICRSTITHKSL